MSIYVKNAADGGLEVVTGVHRLKALLDMQGTAWVHNMSTNDRLEVHEVGGQLVALTPTAVAAIQSVADTAISNASEH